MAKDAESSGGITESASDLMRRAAFDIKGAEGFVLALFWVLRLRKNRGGSVSIIGALKP